MSQKTREELLPRLRQRYVSGNREGKGRMLDEFCEQWQCDRKHAIKLFSGKVGWGGQVGVKRGAPTLYGADVVKVLEAIWRVGEQACGKRLKSMLPLWLPHYEAEYGRPARDARHPCICAANSKRHTLFAKHQKAPVLHY